MKNRFQVVSALTKEMRRFYKNEQGVYYMMMMLLSMPLLGLMAFAVDGSGMLLDKARLMQATEQAALALVAENNASRKNKEHEEIARQKNKGKLTEAESDQFGEDTFSAMQNRRNQELLKGIVGLYLPQAKLDKDFSYQCGEEKIYHDGNGEKINIAVKTVVACQVAGNISRSSWLYNENLNGLTFEKETSIHSGDVFVQKERNAVIPIDLVMVLDFSTSMLDNIAGDNTKGNWKNNGREPDPDKRRAHILRDTVSEITNILLPTKQTENTSLFNRIGFVTFSTYAQERGIPKRVFPFIGKRNISKDIYLREEVYDYAKGKYVPFGEIYNKEHGLESYNTGDCHGYYVIYNDYRVRECRASIDLDKVMKRALYLGDRDTISRIFNDYVDMEKTISQINEFDGKPRNYELVYDEDNNIEITPYLIGKKGDVESYSGKPPGLTTSEEWFTVNNRNVVETLEKTELLGATNISSGLIVGANYLMDKNKVTAKEIGSNTQRIMLMLSDGEDNTPTADFIENLLNRGVCDRIRQQANKLQDKDFKELPTKLAFVAFGYNPPANLAAAWKKCVGDKNYYIVNNKEALLEAFKQIISIDEEVGRATSKKPSFLK